MSSNVRNILESSEVKSWLRFTEVLEPRFRRSMAYVVGLRANGLSRVEAFRYNLNTYRRLRDCLGRPCPELEDWLQQNILPLDTELEGLLEASIPTTLLGDESVKQWFGIAERIDMPLCDEMKDVIRKWDFGFEASTPISDELMQLFEILYSAMDIPCEPLFKWFSKVNAPRDPILVVLTGSPCVEPLDSAAEGAKTTATEADVTMKDIASARMPLATTPLFRQLSEEEAPDPSPPARKRLKMGSSSRADTVMLTRSASEQNVRAPISPLPKEQGAPSELRISAVRDDPEPSRSVSVVTQTQQRASSSRLEDPLVNRLTGVKVPEYEIARPKAGSIFIQRTKKDAEPKSKKVLSPYNLFVKVQLPVWREANPGIGAKDAMSAVTAMWKDSPENPKNASGGKEKKAPSKPAPKAKEADQETSSSDTD